MDCFKLIVTSENKARSAVRHLGATHLVSIADPGATCPPRPPSIAESDHLALFFYDDDDTTRPHAPKRHHAEALIALGGRMTAENRAVVHCRLGIRRSTAAAFLMAVGALGLERAQEALDMIVAARPQGSPNLLLVGLGDDLLGAGGKLVRMAARYGIKRAAGL